MASQIDVCNLAATILGKPGITSIQTPVSNAEKVFALEFDIVRRGLLMGPGTWRFSILRTQLSPLATQPPTPPFTTWYALPGDCIRPVQIGDMWAGVDMSDYRQGPTDADWAIENNKLLCDYGSPLNFQYVSDIQDTTQMDPNFIIVFGAELAWVCCERLTGSDAKQAAAEKRKDKAYSDATASNAFLNPPQHLGDDSWILSRMQ